MYTRARDAFTVSLRSPQSSQMSSLLCRSVIRVGTLVNRPVGEVLVEKWEIIGRDGRNKLHRICVTSYLHSLRVLQNLL